MNLSTRLAAGISSLIVVTGLLAACATPAGSGDTPGPTATATDDSGGHDDDAVGAAWLDSGRMIGIVTQGSSTCIPVAEEPTYADGVMTVKLVDAEGDTACTADHVARATVVAVPEGVDPTQDLEIRLTGVYTGDTDLDGVPGLAAGGSTDYQPSAGWADDGQFVILTWGSSTCVPVISDVAATSATEVTVTFADPPADQACTMDMAPRATVAQVTGEFDDDVVAILTGDQYDNVRVPIIGED